MKIHLPFNSRHRDIVQDVLDSGKRRVLDWLPEELKVPPTHSVDFSPEVVQRLLRAIKNNEGAQTILTPERVKMSGSGFFEIIGRKRSGDVPEILRKNQRGSGEILVPPGWKGLPLKVNPPPKYRIGMTTAKRGLGTIPDLTGGVRNKGLNNEELEGAGWLGDWWSRIKGERPGTNAVRELLKNHGNAIVQKISVLREPISKNLEIALNLFSAGKFGEAKKEANYDELFHLSMTVILSDGYIFRTEKDPNVSIKNADINNYNHLNAYFLPNVGDKKITLNNFFGNAMAKAGSNDAFFRYDALNCNCQHYISNLMSANGLMTPELKTYILQNVDQIKKKLPGATKNFMDFVTDLGSVFRGSGERGHEVKRVRKPRKPRKPRMKGGDGFHDFMDQMAGVIEKRRGEADANVFRANAKKVEAERHQAWEDSIKSGKSPAEATLIQFGNDLKNGIKVAMNTPGISAVGSALSVLPGVGTVESGLIKGLNAVSGSGLKHHSSSKNPRGLRSRSSASVGLRSRSPASVGLRSRSSASVGLRSKKKLLN